MAKLDVQDYIGSRLRDERKALSKTQEEFARELGCSQSQVSKYEDGARPITAVDLLKLASVVQVPVWEFYPPAADDDAYQGERELIEAWRERKLGALLKLLAERFG